jgi:hypothetical protein
MHLTSSVLNVEWRKRRGAWGRRQSSLPASYRAWPAVVDHSVPESHGAVISASCDYRGARTCDAPGSSLGPHLNRAVLCMAARWRCGIGNEPAGTGCKRGNRGREKDADACKRAATQCVCAPQGEAEEGDAPGREARVVMERVCEKQDQVEGVVCVLGHTGPAWISGVITSPCA